MPALIFRLGFSFGRMNGKPPSSARVLHDSRRTSETAGHTVRRWFFVMFFSRTLSAVVLFDVEELPRPLAYPEDLPLILPGADVAVTVAIPQGMDHCLISGASTLSGDAASLTDGVSRDENGSVHHWQSAELPAEVWLEWERPVSLSRLEIKCDTNLQCNIMMRKTPPKAHHTKEAPPEVIKSILGMGEELDRVPFACWSKGTIGCHTVSIGDLPLDGIDRRKGSLSQPHAANKSDSCLRSYFPRFSVAEGWKTW